MIWSNTTYKISYFLLQREETESPSQQRFSTSTRDGGFISLLPFKLAIDSSTKVNTPNPTLSSKTATSLQSRSSWSMSRAASLLHSVLGDKPLLQEGCCIRFYLKDKQKNHQDSCPLNPLAVLPLQSFGDYNFVFVRSAPWRPTCCTPFLGGKERECCWPKIVFNLAHWEMRLWDRSPAHSLQYKPAAVSPLHGLNLDVFPVLVVLSITVAQIQLLLLAEFQTPSHYICPSLNSTEPCSEDIAQISSSSRRTSNEEPTRNVAAMWYSLNSSRNTRTVLSLNHYYGHYIYCCISRFNIALIHQQEGT